MTRDRNPAGMRSFAPVIIPSKPNLISLTYSAQHKLIVLKKKMIAINLTGDDFKRHATAMDIVKLLQYCFPREKTRLLMTFIDASAAITLLEEGLEKNSGSARDSNPRSLRCRCSALPTELSKPRTI